MKIQEIQIPGKLSRAESEYRRSFLKQISIIPEGENIKSCIQCGTCTGSCPLSYAMDISPRELIALFRAGDMESILKSRTIWVCASCYTCQSRCPSTIKITDIIYALKRTAMEQRVYNKKFPTHALSDAFMKSMNRFGRLNEPRLMVYYFLRTEFWKAFGFLPLGLKMLKKGRLEFKASKIKSINGFRKILKKAEKINLPAEPITKSYKKDTIGYSAIGQ